MDIYTSNALAQASGIAGLGSSVWLVVLLAVMVFYTVYSGVLIFHWFSFSMRARTAVVATILYLSVSVVFVFSMLASVVTLTTL